MMDTRGKIFDAALIEFAENGFKKTTIRNICTRAGVNVAAINYHFSGKAELYASIFEFLFKSREDVPIVNTKVEAKDFIESWINEHLSDEEKESKISVYRRKIMLKELSDASDNFSVLVKKYIKPNFEVLVRSFKLCMPQNTPDEKVQAECLLMIGKCVFFQVHNESITGLLGKDYISKNREMIKTKIIEGTFSSFQ